jgi:hypothetical protein
MECPTVLKFSVFRYAIGTFAFRTQPQSINVTADPSFCIPGQRTTVVSILVLKLIQQDERVDFFVVHTMTSHIWKGGCTVSVGKYGDRGSACGSRPPSMLSIPFARFHAHLAVIHAHLAMVHAPIEPWSILE